MPATPSCSAHGAPIIVRPNGYAASEGDSVRGSPCDAPARLRTGLQGAIPQIPTFEERCIRSGFVALPHRTAAGTPRSGALPGAAHRPSRCTASYGTDPWTPASLRPSSCGCCAGNRGLEAMRGVPQSGGTFLMYSAKDKGVSPHQVAAPSSGTGSERAQGRERSGCGSPPRARVLPPEAALRSYGGYRRER